MILIIFSGNRGQHIEHHIIASGEHSVRKLIYCTLFSFRPLLSEKRWNGVLSKETSARIYKCGKKMGATRLAEQILLVVTQLHSLAWPLSLLVADGMKTES